MLIATDLEIAHYKGFEDLRNFNFVLAKLQLTSRRAMQPG